MLVLCKVQLEGQLEQTLRVDYYCWHMDVFVTRAIESIVWSDVSTALLGLSP